MKGNGPLTRENKDGLHTRTARVQQIWRRTAWGGQEQHASSWHQWSADRPLALRMTLCTILDHLHGGVESTDMRESEAESPFLFLLFSEVTPTEHAPVLCWASIPPSLLIVAFPFTERKHICHPFWILPWHNTLRHKSMPCPWVITLEKQHKASDPILTRCLPICLSSSSSRCIYSSIIYLSIIYPSNLDINIIQGPLEKQRKME